MPISTSSTVVPMIGRAQSRVDGPLKVSGSAIYTSDHRFPGLLYAVPLCATIATGRLTSIDTEAATGMPGVRDIITHQNIGTFYRVNKASGARQDETRPPLEDDVIRYYGQYVALVVADSFEQATAAAQQIKVTYQANTPNVSMHLSPDETPEVDSHRGDPESAFHGAAVKLDHVYTTPPETHNPMELHASVAIFEHDQYTLYETSQAIVNHKNVMAQMLGVPPENVRVVTEYMGGGFGGKLWPWTHSLLAAAAARRMQRPIKLVVSRKMMFQNVGHRTNTQQRVRLSANRDGKLQSLQQDFLFHCAREDKSKEDCGEATPYLYSTANLRVNSGFARRDIGPNTSMRGPGAVPGLFAIESAMDELALALNMDPVQLRLINEPAIDESLNIPFSSRHMKECLTRGAETFGWAKRNPMIGSMRQNGVVLGWGMAACSWRAKRLPAQVMVMLNADGSLRVSSGTQDIGTGTYTVMAQMAANLSGLPLNRVQVVIGDTKLSEGPMSGGSMATASLVPAVSQATRAAMDNILQLAVATPGSPFHGQATEALSFADGQIRHKDGTGQSLPFEQLLGQAKLGNVTGMGKSQGSQSDADADKLSIHSYGAHFVEVTWEPALARLRISRVVTVIDGGKVLNTRTGRNQIEGAIMMGVGMALFEETTYDGQNGAPINSNLADYVMATHADTPAMDVIFLDYPDYALNELGARGIGEIGLAGFATAVTSAVHHATGVRVRDLPVRIEDLLSSSVAAA